MSKHIAKRTVKYTTHREHHRNDSWPFLSLFQILCDLITLSNRFSCSIVSELTASLSEPKVSYVSLLLSVAGEVTFESLSTLTVSPFFGGRCPVATLFCVSGHAFLHGVHTMFESFRFQDCVAIC